MTLKTDFSDGDIFYAGTTSDTDKLNGITNTINNKSSIFGDGSDGSSYTLTSDSTPSYPYNNTYVNYIALNDGDTDFAQNIVSANVKAITYADAIVQSSATTIPTGMTKVFVTPLMYEALATDDSITADVSLNDGAAYTTGLPVNTWSEITSADGTDLIIKMNLNTNDGSTTPKVKGWGVLLD
jgi:hypothetical protein